MSSRLRARAIARLERGPIVPGGWIAPVHLHQHIDVELVLVLLRRQVRRSELLPGDGGAQRLNPLERRLDVRARFIETTACAGEPRETGQRAGFAGAIADRCPKGERLTERRQIPLDRRVRLKRTRVERRLSNRRRWRERRGGKDGGEEQRCAAHLKEDAPVRVFISPARWRVPPQNITWPLGD